jgi:hypothetical protein
VAAYPISTAGAWAGQSAEAPWWAEFAETAALAAEQFGRGFVAGLAAGLGTGASVEWTVQQACGRTWLLVWDASVWPYRPAADVCESFEPTALVVG